MCVSQLLDGADGNYSGVPDWSAPCRLDVYMRRRTVYIYPREDVRVNSGKFRNDLDKVS